LQLAPNVENLKCSEWWRSPVPYLYGSAEPVRSESRSL
jgi:hypothetical protein